MMQLDTDILYTYITASVGHCWLVMLQSLSCLIFSGRSEKVKQHLVGPIRIPGMPTQKINFVSDAQEIKHIETTLLYYKIQEYLFFLYLTFTDCNGAQKHHQCGENNKARSSHSGRSVVLDLLDASLSDEANHSSSTCCCVVP